MYLGVDIGGTKTLVATLADDGQIIDSRRFASDPDYQKFLRDLGQNLAELQLDSNLRCCVGVSGLVDRQTGVAHALGNLPWTEVSIRDDVSRLLGGQPVIIENDARLAGLSEAQLLKDHYHNILFLTVSTGIGGALIQHGRIARALEDMEIGKMPLIHDGGYVQWEEFAGGRAIAKQFNKKAAELTDPADWQTIAEQLMPGIAIGCSIMQPDVIVIGGSVGKFTDKFSQPIMDFLATHLHANVRQPQAIVAAQRPDEAVIYGCYDLAKQSHQEAHHG